MPTQCFDPLAAKADPISGTEQVPTTVSGWQAYLVEAAQRLRPYFARRQAWQRAVAYVEGLLSSTERKNAWQLAEVNGDATPYGFQHLLGRAVWQADHLRDALYAYVVAHLGDPEAVLVVDETGFLKKGDQSAGVARQYSGTAGKVENCQVGVFLAYASRLGQSLLDRALYLPVSWAKDARRRQRAGIAPEVEFASKPELARAMLERAFASGVPASWVVGDSVYGDARPLRLWLEDQEKAYVLAVSGKERVEVQGRPCSVRSVLEGLDEGAWQRLSAGVGSKGPRLYDWQSVELTAPPQAGWQRCLLVRRSLKADGKLTAYAVFAPCGTDPVSKPAPDLIRGTGQALATLVAVAGRRWCIEMCFEAAKSEVGLDEYEVRSWTGWYRHVTLSMWALALLSVVRAAHLEAPEKNAYVRAVCWTSRRRGAWSRCRVKSGVSPRFEPGGGSECAGDTAFVLASGGDGVARCGACVGLEQMAATPSMDSPMLSLPATPES